MGKTSQWSPVFRSTIAGLVAVVSGCDSTATDRSGMDRIAAPSAASPPAPSGPELAAAPSSANFRMLRDRQGDAAEGPDLLSKQTEPSPFRFAEIARDAGIDFVHFSGMTEEKYFPTANGSGVAMFDYDGDGRLDLYFATATLLPLGTARKGPNRLFKNLGGEQVPGRDRSRPGLGFAGFCHGIVVGDIDNDGDPDVFLCNYGPNVLFLNNGDGTFRDISKSAGIDRPNWSVGRRVPRLRQRRRPRPLRRQLRHLEAPRGRPVLRPARAEAGPALLLADHRSARPSTCSTATTATSPSPTSTTRRSSPSTPRPRSRSPDPTAAGSRAVTADLNGDGRIDIYVANDMSPNFLFLNRGDGTFEDATESSGAAYDEKGQAQSGMGVDAEDVNGDGLPDLLVTNFANEYNTLYHEPGQRPVHGRDRLLRAGRRHHAVRRLGDRPGRLRQRRLARQLRRQRPRRRQPPGARAALRVRGAAACSSST